MAQPIIKKLYLASDALFDLRQGTLATINTEFAADVTTNKSYYFRETDEFSSDAIDLETNAKLGTLSKEVYSKVYEQFKDRVIRNSVMTKILPFVHTLCREFIRQTASTPFLSGFELDVNLYPFTFSHEETTELLECLVEILGTSFKINIINLSPENMSLEYVRNNYTALIMYDYSTWLNLHTEQLQKKPLAEVGLYVPKLYFIRTLTDEEARELKKNKTDLFEFMSRLLSPFFVIQHLPIAMFCANIPSNLDEYSELVK